MTFKSIVLAISLIVMSMLLGGLWYVSPIFKPFPKPTGQFSIGTTILEFTDQSRKEIYSENPHETRSLVVRFFYPTNSIEGVEKYSYLGAKMPYFQQHIAAQHHLPDSICKLLLRNIKTHSFINAPIANVQATYPVVLFSHGGFGYPSDTYLAILENLASHGYIVAAIDHPYFNGLTLYKNGKVVTEQKLSNQFNKMNQAEQKAFLSTIVNTFNADQKFLVDELAKFNEDQNNIFYHHLDLNRIAAMGHSAGGTSSIEFCRSDNRCKTAIDLDGWYDHAIGQEPINKPLLLIFAEKSIEVTEPTPEYLKRKELTREQYYEREKNIKEHKEKLCSVPTCAMVIISEASHSDFDDLMFLKWPFRSWNAIEPYKTMALINGKIIEFLDRYLK